MLTTSQKLPTLENGDRVTRDEFEWRYHQQQVLSVLNSGVSSTEHQAFVEQLGKI
ncbi:MAG: hypothetical protein ACOC04_03740 [Halothece sp.]